MRVARQVVEHGEHAVIGAVGGDLGGPVPIAVGEAVEARRPARRCGPCRRASKPKVPILRAVGRGGGGGRRGWRRRRRRRRRRRAAVAAARSDEELAHEAVPRCMGCVARGIAVRAAPINRRRLPRERARRRHLRADPPAPDEDRDADSRSRALDHGDDEQAETSAGAASEASQASHSRDRRAAARTCR